MIKKAYPNAVFGCGHLSPIGWCGECAMRTNGSYGKVKCDGDHAPPRCEDPECWRDDEPDEDLDANERGDEFTETDDE